MYRLPEQLQSKVDEMYAKVRRREVVLRTAMWVRVACSRRCRQFAALLLQDVARMNPGEAGKMDHEYKSFLAELGGGPPPLEAGAAHRGGASCLHRVAQFSAGIKKHAGRNHLQSWAHPVPSNQQDSQAHAMCYAILLPLVCSWRRPAWTGPAGRRAARFLQAVCRQPVAGKLGWN